MTDTDHSIPPAPDDAWRNSGVQVIPADSLDTNTAQTPGMNRAAAINFARTGAKKLWAGTVTIHADAKVSFYASLCPAPGDQRSER